MTADLNLWRLEYEGVDLEFGTYDTGHPLTQQVAIADGELVTDDMPHPLSDGSVFGRDRAPGMALAFAGAHLDESRPASRQWVPRLDAAGPFATAWKARRFRRTPGWVATLTNVDRGRMVYGRPRGYQPGLADVRKGWLEWTAGFVGSDDRFYDTELKTHAATVLGGGPVSASTPPIYPGDPDLHFPNNTTARTFLAPFVATNDGDEATWPVITFTGGRFHRLQMQELDGTPVWTLRVSTHLGDHGTFRIDTRPWSRSITHNGKPRPGQLAGSALDDCEFPPGSFQFVFSAANSGGQSDLELEWRDAYSSL